MKKTTDETKTNTSGAVDVCPKCGSPMSPEETTKSGRKLRRCSAGSWNAQTKKVDGCSFVQWMAVEPVTLEEACPKCGSPLVLAVTRFGKKMKKCSTGGWDAATKTATGCDYVEWINGTTEELDEACPQCGSKLVLYTTSTGKRMKKCSTGGWDKVKRMPTGCTFVQWLKPGEYEKNGEEFLPPEPEEG